MKMNENLINNTNDYLNQINTQINTNTPTINTNSSFKQKKVNPFTMAEFTKESFEKEQNEYYVSKGW